MFPFICCCCCTASCFFHFHPSSMKPEASKKKKAQAVSRTDRAGLQLSVGRIHRLLRRGRYSQRIGSDAPVYLAAVLEYLVAEMLELAGVAAKANRKSRITPRFLQLAVRQDAELDELLDGVTFSQGGVVPHIEKALLPKTGKATSDKHKADRVKTAPKTVAKKTLKAMAEAEENDVESDVDSGEGSNDESEVSEMEEEEEEEMEEEVPGSQI